MKLFRRGHLWLVWHTVERAWVYDADADTSTPDMNAQRLLGDTARDWWPAPEGATLPPGLLKHLILPFRKKAR